MEELKSFFRYLLKILSKWILWVFGALDLFGLVLVYFEQIKEIPAFLYSLIIWLGFLLAGYQVYLDSEGGEK